MMVVGKSPLLLYDLIFKPDHSVIKQSYMAREQLSGSNINGDGFGVGFYEPAIDQFPCIFTGAGPAWSNTNMLSLSRKMSARLFFCHVRAATPGLTVSEMNCHPFACGRFMFMHNGHIEGFSTIRRKLLFSLPQECFEMVGGTTDSEHAFALFMSKLLALNPSAQATCDTETMAQAMEDAIGQICEWQEEAGIAGTSLLNFCVTNGESVVASRFCPNEDHQCASLYLASGTDFTCDETGHATLVQESRMENLVMIASEPITHDSHDWLEAPRNHLILIPPTFNVQFHPIPARCQGMANSVQ